MRKTISFDEEVYEAIQQERAKLLLKGKDVNFTKTVNELLKKALNIKVKANE